MNGLILVLIVLSATSVHAGEAKIIETESGVTVEYDGASGASSASAASAASGAASVSGNPSGIAARLANENQTMMVKTMSIRIEQLKKEVAEILQLTGRESVQELEFKKAQADEKSRQIEAYNNEIGQLTGQNGADTPDQAQLREQPARLQNYRQEKKQRIRELKKLRMVSPPAESQ